MEKSRRDFIKSTGTAAAALVLNSHLLSGKSSYEALPNPIGVFTKCLQFLDYDQLGVVLAETGFKNAELSVRKGGHVLPAQIKTDLPLAIKALHKSGIIVPMMVSDIMNPDDPITEMVLGTASDSGVKFYRMGYLTYDPDKSVIENLDIHRRTFEKFERINRKFNIHGCYQNHSGVRVGGPVWDLYTLLKDLDPTYIGTQYDIRHAVVEGGVSWPLGMKLLAPWIKMNVTKDFIWEKVNGKWKITNVPLGEGMVDFDSFFKLYISLGISGPLTIHYEYDLGGAQSGSKSPTMSLEKISELISTDLRWLRSKLKEHGISGSFS